jgi:tripeptidyl-peptidase-1
MVFAVERNMRKTPADHEDFQRLHRADPRKNMKFRISLKQHNLDVLQAKLMDISNPESSNYGQWMKKDEVLDLIAPEQAVVDSIAAWLRLNGAMKVDATGRDIIKAEASVRTIEALFKTEMHEFEHTSGKKQTRHFGSITIPDEFDQHITLVTGITELWGPSVIKPLTRPAEPIGNKRNDVKPGYVIPEQLRVLYNLPSAFQTNAASSVCVAEFQDDASFEESDNTDFNKQMLENVKVNQKVGPFAPNPPDGESTLDVQYAFSVALNTTSWFWTVDGWMMEFATDLFNAKSRPLVVSMSWGWPEPLQCQIDSCTSAQTYVQQVNTEFMKVTALGVTLLAASGDQGAPGDQNPGCSSSKPPLSNIFPGASPYVLSVGATMISGTVSGNPYKAPACKTHKCATSKTEVVCTYPGSLITSGGGFSTYTTRPSWQNAAVSAYLASGVTLPPSKDYNSGNRAFPDVSALGHSYLIAIQGSLEQVDGTSCSSPVWGGLISLLNSARQNAGKAPLGFVNPLLYTAVTKSANYFQDITSGNNKCTESCCSNFGFTATKGWDPVTGLGTPNFGNLLTYVKSLP